MPSRIAIETAVSLCLAREREERRLASEAADQGMHDIHFMRAERYADRAWAIAEDHDVAFVPSAIWAQRDDPDARMSSDAARALEPAPVAV